MLARTKDVSIAIDDKARTAFFSHYVLGLSKTYDVIEALYIQPNLEKHLSASIDAVSLAFFSFQHQSPKTLELARERYSHALSALKKSLHTQENLRSNSTLAAVLLLDLFEKITGTTTPPPDVSTTHVKGALSLVSLRSHEELHNNNISLRLAKRLSVNLLISCLVTNSPIPSQLVQLRSDLQPYVHKDDPKEKLSGLIMKYCNILTGIQEGELSAVATIEAARNLDLGFKALGDGVPSGWQYCTFQINEPSELVLGDRLDIYPGHFVTQVWNVLRFMRILLQNLIADSEKKLDKTVTLVETINTIDAIAKGICASVPQYTGYSHEKITKRSNAAIQRLRCYTLLCPLYVAGKYSSPSTNIRPWAIAQMRYLADKLNMSKAALVADTLENGCDTSPWVVYTMLGSYALAA